MVNADGTLWELWDPSPEGGGIADSQFSIAKLTKAGISLKLHREK